MILYYHVDCFVIVNFGRAPVDNRNNLVLLLKGFTLLK